MESIELKQGEYKDVEFEITDVDGEEAPLDSATLTFTARKTGSGTQRFVIENDDMDKTNADVGIIILTFTEANTAVVGHYVTELLAVYSPTHKVKSNDIILEIIRAVDRLP